MPKLRIAQKHLDNYLCPNCGKDRKCQFRYRKQWCKECGHIKTAQKINTRVTKNCLVCTKVISVPRCLVQRKKFCSIDCRIKHMVGRKLTESHKQKIGEKSLGHRLSFESRKAISAKSQGLTSNQWNGFASTQNHLDRVRFLKTFKKQVLIRDDYTCQVCNKRGGILQVDHIQPFAEYVELRFSMNNLRTLCQECHYFITFGKKKPECVKLWGVSRKEQSYG